MTNPIRKMKRLKELSREELVEESSPILSVREKEANRKENERKIIELEKQEKLLTDIEKVKKNGLSDLSEFTPKLQELFRLKDGRNAK